MAFYGQMTNQKTHDIGLLFFALSVVSFPPMDVENPNHDLQASKTGGDNLTRLDPKRTMEDVIGCSYMFDHICISLFWAQFHPKCGISVGHR